MKGNIVITAALIILLSACKDQLKEAPVEAEKTAIAEDMVQLSPEQVKNSGITIGKPEKKEMHTTLKVSGVVDVPPQNIVSVSIPLGGYLKKTTLIPGARISKGTVLATLEDQQYIQLQQDYLTAKNGLQYLEADYNRQKGLNETKAASDKVFQKAKTDFEGQRILARSLGEKLKLIGLDPEALNETNISRSISVYSPISGYVTKVNVNIGKYVNPEDVLFELINPDDLHVRLTVFENDASSLSVGQKMLCSANSRPDEKYRATIHLITPNIGENRAADVHCHLEGNGEKLFPGTFVNAEIELNNASVVAVPEESIVKWENEYYLFSEEAKNTFKLVPVEIGALDNGYREIKSALPSNSIVIKNAYTILMKMKNTGEEG